ncbi:YceI family protein [Leisingera sp. JC1]|uniref:YceI family protein n=1 Tax=Leisingera sp. JC1 TaxID=1855282 RepID=UPI000802D14E|nr:YceI family protein [Leisingera sp. JC1]OBY26576.1 hypothetical protein A9D60_18655 [Leisingera sp. JC1]
MKHYLSAAILTALAGISPISQVAAEPLSYDIDLVHSGISFRINHLGFSDVIGMARDFSGAFVFDADAPTEGASLDVTVKVGSLFTNNAQRDSDIQGADWFNAVEFPEITFTGTDYEATSDAGGKITGDLTIIGVTKAVTLDVKLNGTGNNPWDGSRVAGFGATTTIKRSDFGLTSGIPQIGDEVELTIQVEGRGRE